MLLSTVLTAQDFDSLNLEMSIVTRVHFALFVLSFAALQGCTTAQVPSPKPVYANPAMNRSAGESTTASTPATDTHIPLSKIVRFKDALGAVVQRTEDAKLQAMIAAFDYCDREQRLAFVTPPLAYSPRINYSRVSTYSNRLPVESSGSVNSFVAPFECIDQKHSVKTGLLESEDIPSVRAIRESLGDSRGGVIVHAAGPESKFRENDIVVKVADFRVESRAELVRAVDLSPLGDVTFTVVRGDRLVTVSGQVHDTTTSTSENALKLLEALCKETGSSAPSCARHAFLTAVN